MTLLLVVLLLAAFLSIAAGIFQIAFTEYRLSGELSDSFRALYAADEGIERLFFYDRVLDSALGCSGITECHPAPQSIDFGNGVCLELQLSRETSAITTLTAIGEFRCGGSPITVRRALEATYQKEAGPAPAATAFWTFDWGSGESAATQNVEDIINDNRAIPDQADGVRGETSASELTKDPLWINPEGGNCAVGGNCALSFDAANDVVRVNLHGNLNDLPALTISAWMYPKSSSGGKMIADKWIETGVGNRRRGGFRFQLDDTASGALKFTAGVNDVTLGRRDLIRISSASVLTPSQWQHVMVTWDGTPSAANAHIYVNNAEVSYATSQDASVAARWSDVASVFNIGNMNDLTRSFNGCMDNVRIYSLVLSDAERAADFGSYAPGNSCP